MNMNQVPKSLEALAGGDLCGQTIYGNNLNGTGNTDDNITVTTRQLDRDIGGLLFREEEIVPLLSATLTRAQNFALGKILIQLHIACAHGNNGGILGNNLKPSIDKKKKLSRSDGPFDEVMPWKKLYHYWGKWVAASLPKTGPLVDDLRRALYNVEARHHKSQRLKRGENGGSII